MTILTFLEGSSTSIDACEPAPQSCQIAIWILSLCTPFSSYRESWMMYGWHLFAMAARICALPIQVILCKLPQIWTDYRSGLLCSDACSRGLFIRWDIVYYCRIAHEDITNESIIDIFKIKSINNPKIFDGITQKIDSRWVRCRSMTLVFVNGWKCGCGC